MRVGILGKEVRMMELGAALAPAVNPARTARGSEGQSGSAPILFHSSRY